MLREMFKVVNARCPGWLQLGAQVRNLRNFQKSSAISKLLSGQPQNGGGEFKELTQKRILECLRTGSVLQPEHERRDRHDHEQDESDHEDAAENAAEPVEERKNFHIQNFGRDVIEVADALSMAIATIPVEKQMIPAVQSVLEGLKMTEALLQQILQRHGLQRVMPLNEKFDPRYHEALKKKVVQGTQPNVVVEVGRVGYKLHDRCIRPALVTISE